MRAGRGCADHGWHDRRHLLSRAGAARFRPTRKACSPARCSRPSAVPEQHAGLVPGGTVGLALLLHYTNGVGGGGGLVRGEPASSMPLAWCGSAGLHLRTALGRDPAVAVSWWLPHAVRLEQLDATLAAVLGGLLCGCGMLILFRHGASLGGLNVLVLRLQDRFGWPAGKVQMAVGAVIVVGGSALVADWRRFALSVLACRAQSVLAFNCGTMPTGLTGAPCRSELWRSTLSALSRASRARGVVPLNDAGLPRPLAALIRCTTRAFASRWRRLLREADARMPRWRERGRADAGLSIAGEVERCRACPTQGSGPVGLRTRSRRRCSCSA